MRPEGDNLLRLARFFGVEPELILRGEGEPDAGAAPGVRQRAPAYGGANEKEAVHELRLSARVRIEQDLRSLGPPGEETERKLKGLHLQREHFQAWGKPVPEWLWALIAQVQAGER